MADEILTSKKLVFGAAGGAKGGAAPSPQPHVELIWCHDFRQTDLNNLKLGHQLIMCMHDLNIT